MYSQRWPKYFAASVFAVLKNEKENSLFCIKLDEAKIPTSHAEKEKFENVLFQKNY